ncbi:hypothetical protein N9B72_00760 [Bacteriovoracaceae bacterium]|nr:hypothetical protein [Bacteriovoracaceae bacterium]
MKSLLILLSVTTFILSCGKNRNEVTTPGQDLIKEQRELMGHDLLSHKLKFQINNLELMSLDKNESIRYLSRIRFQKSFRRLDINENLMKKVILHPQVFKLANFDLHEVRTTLDDNKYAIRDLNMKIELNKSTKVLSGLELSLAPINNKPLKPYQQLLIKRNDYQQDDILFNYLDDRSVLDKLTVHEQNHLPHLREIYTTGSFVSYIDKMNLNNENFTKQLENNLESNILLTVSTPSLSKNLFISPKNITNLKDLLTTVDKTIRIDDYGNIREFKGLPNQLDKFSRSQDVSQDSYTWQFFTTKLINPASPISSGDHIFALYGTIKELSKIDLVTYKTKIKDISIAATNRNISLNGLYSQISGTYKVISITKPTAAVESYQGQYDVYHSEPIGRWKKPDQWKYCNYNRTVLGGRSSIPIEKNLSSHFKMNSKFSIQKRTIFFETNDKIIFCPSSHNYSFTEFNHNGLCLSKTGYGRHQINKPFIYIINGDLNLEVRLYF